MTILSSNIAYNIVKIKFCEEWQTVNGVYLFPGLQK